MSNRAIDRFRPQLTSRPKISDPGLPTTQAIPEAAANHPDTMPSAPAISSSAQPTLYSTDHAEIEATLELPEDPPELENSETDSDQVLNRPIRQAVLSHTRRQLLRGVRLAGMPLVWVGLAAFCGGTGYAAFTWLSTIPPVPDCDRLWFFSMDSDKLYCAEQVARSKTPKSLQAGINLVQPWVTNHQLSPKATRLYRDWSKQLFQIASQKALENDLDAAITLAETIKPGNPAYRDAKNAILEWKKLRDRDQLLTNTIEAALKIQDWKKAESELQPRSSKISDYQHRQLNRFRERIVTERIAFNQLQQVREVVKAHATEVDPLGRAIQLALQITPSSYASKSAQTDIQQWSKTLISIAETRLQQNNVTGAIAAIRWIPGTIALPPQIQDLLWVSRAQKTPTAQANQSAEPLFPWQQTVLLAALHQIQPDSPLYPLAQSQQSRLEPSIQDLTQLSLANLVAKVPYTPALQVAIQMAQTISRDRPHRIDAQTLIADWRIEIQRMQDRPYLMQARKLAASRTIKDMQAAIALARKIPLGRALRPAAQAAIFDWQQQIQAIEDQPILNKARQLAQQSHLETAIQEATKITTGRALHPEAQAAIQTWTKTIQTTQDRPILDEAKALATQGNFGIAIDVAYQIAPGRALYEEAQTAIAQWSAQLEKTRRSQRYMAGWNEWDQYRQRRE